MIRESIPLIIGLSVSMGDLFTGLNLPIIHMTEIEIYLLLCMPWDEEVPVSFVMQELQFSLHNDYHIPWLRL